MTSSHYGFNGLGYTCATRATTKSSYFVRKCESKK